MTEQGFNMERLLAGEDLTRANVATQEQVDRFNMLKKFMDQSSLMDRGSYATADDINSALTNLSNYGIPISQTTGPRKTT
jgi:ABC-type transporter Mla subunit MlaD